MNTIHNSKTVKKFFCLGDTLCLVDTIDLKIYVYKYYAHPSELITPQQYYNYFHKNLGNIDNFNEDSLRTFLSMITIPNKILIKSSNFEESNVIAYFYKMKGMLIATLVPKIYFKEEPSIPYYGPGMEPYILFVYIEYGEKGKIYIDYGSTGYEVEILD